MRGYKRGRRIVSNQAIVGGDLTMLKFGLFGILLVAFVLVCSAESCDNDGESSEESSYEDAETSTCDTPPSCPQNEIYSDCANGFCGLRYCTQYGAPMPFCRRFNMNNCQSGCLCKAKYLRNPHGVCVPQEDCPKYLCTGNEVYSTCVNGGCDARNCSQLGKPVPCIKLDPASCIKGCVCINGYLRDNNGKCVPTNQCPKQNDPCEPGDNPGTNETCASDVFQRLMDGNTEFTGNFLSAVVQKNIGKSVVMSPFSVIIPLSIFFQFTKPGDSADQLGQLLKLKTKDELRCVFPELINSYKSQTQSELNLATKIYASDQEKLTPNFQKETELLYKAEAESLDFSTPEEAARTINKWVELQTRDRIKNLVSPSLFNKFTKLVLVNAIYFLGSWVKQFNPNRTTSGDFYISENEKITKDFMNQEASFSYADIPSLDAKALKMPYKGLNFTYVAFLPNAKDGVVDLVEKLRDPTVLKGALDQLRPGKVIVSIPRYEITTEIDLTNVLTQLNITNLFDDSRSDLDGIIESKEKLFVSAAIQKANIRVDEVGTEAAAANAFVVGATSVQQVNRFIANRSFVYYIFLHDTPLFCGVLAG